MPRRRSRRPLWQWPLIILLLVGSFYAMRGLSSKLQTIDLDDGSSVQNIAFRDESDETEPEDSPDDAARDYADFLATFAAEGSEEDLEEPSSESSTDEKTRSTDGKARSADDGGSRRGEDSDSFELVQPKVSQSDTAGRDRGQENGRSTRPDASDDDSATEKLPPPSRAVPPRRSPRQPSSQPPAGGSPATRSAPSRPPSAPIHDALALDPSVPPYPPLTSPRVNMAPPVYSPSPAPMGPPPMVSPGPGVTRALPTQPRIATWGRKRPAPSCWRRLMGLW